jgi:hypothetical protein
MVVTRGQGALAGPTLFGVSVAGFGHMAWVYDHSACFSFPFGARVNVYPNQLPCDVGPRWQVPRMPLTSMSSK